MLKGKPSGKPTKARQTKPKEKEVKGNGVDISVSVPRPRSQNLPGMEDKGIPALEDWADRYADIRDQRQALTKQEVDLKAEGLELMRKYKRDSYTHDGYKIERITEKEKIKVKTPKHSDDDDE